jgi:hypothetical protein
MVIQVLDIPTEDTENIRLPVTTPQWLKPYLAAAQRSGLTADWETISLSEPITGAEAAVILQNALDLSHRQQDAAEEPTTYADTALAVMNENGLMLVADEALNRAQVADILYKAHTLAQNAPGVAVFQTEQ